MFYFSTLPTRSKSQDSTDDYQNLILVTATIHKLIHATNAETIQKYLQACKPNLKKLNVLRELVGNTILSVDWLDWRKLLKMERRMRWKVHVRCGAEEKPKIISKAYLSLSNRAEKMAEKLAAERGVNAQLYESDPLEWILATEKIQEEVHDTLEKEIQQ